MRDAEESIFEINFSCDSNALDEMCKGSKIAKRMKFELFSRFAVSSVIIWHYDSEVLSFNQ